MNCYEGKDSDYFIDYAWYNQTITVGGTTSILFGDSHYRYNDSNYGNSVDIFVPSYVTHADLSNGYKDGYFYKTMEHLLHMQLLLVLLLLLCLRILML